MNKKRFFFRLGFIFPIIALLIFIILALSAGVPHREASMSDFYDGTFDAQINSPHGMTALLLFFIIILYGFYIIKIISWKSETFSNYAEQFGEGIQSAFPLVGVLGGCIGLLVGIFVLSSPFDALIKFCGDITAWLIPIERKLNMWTLFAILMCSIFIPIMIYVLYISYFKQYYISKFNKNAVRIQATILEVNQTGVYVNQLPQIKIKFKYIIDSKEYTKSTTTIIDYISIGNIQPGDKITISVSEKNPNRFVFV